MVKVAIAGGAGNVGQEVLDALIARKKHEIIILSRKDAPKTEIAPGVKWFQTKYDDVEELTRILQGVHTVLSFMSVAPGDTAAGPQEKLIDAAVRAGVKRFAPSEWASSKLDYFHWYDFKRSAREYLANINKDKKVIEYTLFQFGLFTNYMTYPYKSSKHVNLFETPVNFNDCRALLVDDGEAVITLTAAQDAAKVTALAIEHEGAWPIVSGVKGTDITMNELVALGEKIRGKKFKVEYLRSEDLEAGIVKAPWLPIPEHPSIPVEVRKEIAADMIKCFLLGIKHGALQVSEEWNILLPDYKFTQPEEFLAEAWAAIDAGAQSVFAED
ncbi:2`-hydroxyisoflavone reductase [Fusarium beomiforme]|uniref:2`-hydroxyisoflavone reductase n=1 Tax=Fusarium beomiforme TaxID=44412 RepID=A0A9P5AN62_9HYPO|nr:2`-hydroxyisoflavone reductase [Fusarium beomiforme]